MGTFQCRKRLSTGFKIYVGIGIGINIMFKSKKIKELEEKLYEKVASEIRERAIDQGIWTKALSESDGEKNRAESIYIKLRVNKLKDKSIQDYNSRKKEVQEQQSDEDAIEVVQNVAFKNSYRFKYFSIALFLIGSISLFIAASTDPYGSAEDSGYFVLFLFTGLIVVPLSIYTFYQSHKIEKITDVNILHKKIVRLFWIMIPTSLVVTLVGTLSVIIGLLAFMAFVSMSIDAFRFGIAYKRVVRKSLI